MKTFLFSLVLFLACISCWAQDATSVPAEGSASNVVLALNPAGDSYRPSEENNPALKASIDAAFERKIRRTKVWTKICYIHGWISTGLGALLFLSANRMNDDDVYYDYSDEEEDIPADGACRIAGGALIVEGIAFLCVGYSLQGRCGRLMREYNRVGSTSIFSKDFPVGNCTMTPSVNLMSYDHKPMQGVGAGLTISF